MSTQALQREQVVAHAIREISHIATLPEVTLRIVQLVEDPTSTAQDLNNVIARDPALCARILKVVNSAFYGLPGQIGSINRAIVLLGLNAVKNIAIAASLSKLFKGGQLTPTFSAKDLWSHSIVVGTATKMLADRMRMGLSDESFLAGLIHDLGIMVQMQYDRHKLVEVIERVSPPPGADNPAPVADMLEVELQVFGARSGSSPSRSSMSPASTTSPWRCRPSCAGWPAWCTWPTGWPHACPTASAWTWPARRSPRTSSRSWN
jgi:hypothetical protein